MTRFLTVFFAWIAVYGAVTSILLGFQRSGLNMPIPLQTFLLTIVLVPTMIFVLGPYAAKLAKTITRRFN